MIRELVYSLMCPHCGWTYDNTESSDGLVPFHNSIINKIDIGDASDPELKDAIINAPCPGRGQYPRNPLSDKRRLWNGEPPP